MKYWIALLLILGLSAASVAASDVAGPFGGTGNFYGGFSGRWPPLAGNIGNSGSGPPPTGCGTGVIDASAGCPLPMLGM